MRKTGRIVCTAIAATCIAATAAAQTGADFYKGKTVTYIVSTAPGGGFDL
jgi:tripartite-type tricarboxylate transporter receptor subunit TctC